MIKKIIINCGLASIFYIATAYWIVQNEKLSVLDRATLALFYWVLVIIVGGATVDLKK